MNGGPAARPVGLGAHSARGLLYLFTGATAIKVINFVTQLILLWLLGKADFGVVTLALTIASFIQVIELAGVGDVLVRRRKFAKWAVPGFWFSLALGVLSCSLIVLGAWLTTWIFRNQDAEYREQLFWVMMVLAPSSLSNALAVVPKAQLSHELRFRALAVVNVANMTLQKVLTVALAALGFGPFSFVVPTPITGFITAAFLWWWVRSPFALRPMVRRWKYLVSDSTRLLVADFGRALFDQSDYLLLGMFRSVVEVGVYAVGFMFSLQMMQLMMINLMNILFPAFTRLNDEPQKQYSAFMKSQRILAMLGVTGCFLQAATAAPLAYLLFPEKWYVSIPVMQILSLSMATRMTSGAAVALLKSQGRFNAILWNRWAFLVVQVIALLAILLQGGSYLAVTIAVAIIGSLVGPVFFYSSIRAYGGGWFEVLEVLVKPILCGALSVGAAWWIAQRMAAAGYGNLPQLVETVVVAVALNGLMAWVWMRPVCSDLLLKMRQIMPRRAVA